MFWSVLVFLMFGSLLTLVRPLEYSAKSRLLIVQEAATSVDPYVMAKSNEHLSNVLTNVIISNSFFNETLESGFNIDKEYFSRDVKKQMKRWHKAVKANSSGDVGIIEIEIFHRDKAQAGQIAQAINHTLKSKSNQYLNTGEKLTIKIIDQPIVSTWPTRPNILLNLFLALALGFTYGMSYIYLFHSMPARELTFETPVREEPEVLEPVTPSVTFTESKASVADPVGLMASVVPETAEQVDYEQPEEDPVKPLEVAGGLMYGAEQEMAFEDILNRGDIRNILSK